MRSGGSGLPVPRVSGDVKSRKGPMFVMFGRKQQIRVGKPRESVAVLELREDAHAGDELVLTQRDLDYLTFATSLDAEQGRRRTHGRTGS